MILDGVRDGTVRETDISKQININGYNETFFVYEIQLDKLYYNDKNDRIASYINYYRYVHNDQLTSRNNIEEYNKLMGGYIRNSNSKKLDATKQSIKSDGQQEVGFVACDGRIIDGNRRFTCLRELHKDYPDDDRFKYFKACVLKEDISDKDIKLLELTLQHKDQIVPYEPEEDLLGIYNSIIKTKQITDEEYISHISPTEQKTFARRKAQSILMMDFLNFVKMPENVFIVKNLKIVSGFDTLEIYERTKLKKNEDLKPQLRELVYSFLVLQMPDAVHQIRKIYKFDIERMTAFIEAQKSLVEEIKKELPEINEEHKKAFADKAFNAIDKWVLADQLDKERCKPQEVIDESLRNINTINMAIVKSLPKEDFESFKNKMIELQDLLNIKLNDLTK